MALIERDLANPQGKIDIADIQSPSDFGETSALQLTVQDAESAEAWITSNYWSLRWREADALYQALKLDTPVWTSDGFKPIQDVHPGDKVFGRDGKLHKVLGESPIFYDRPCYELKFNTGETVIADAGHLWETVASCQTIGLGPGNNPNSAKRKQKTANWKRGAYTKIRDTEELFNTRYYGSRKKHNHKIAVTSALDVTDKKFLVDPYTLGAWLGDGDSDAPRITSMDTPIIRHLEAIEKVTAKKQIKLLAAKASRYAFTNYDSKQNSLQTRLDDLGVLYNKHIPSEYFHGSKKQRISLLQGLLDTDGSCSVDGHVTFRNTNKKLVHGVKLLACSLGWRATIKKYNYERYSDGCVYSVHFTPERETPVFRLERKAIRQQTKIRKTQRGYRSIVSITKISSTPVKCISVQGEFYLITDGLIPTHNSPPGILMWEGTTVPRANLNRFVVAETVNSIHPQIMNGLFYESPAFILRPRPNQDANTVRAITELLALEMEEMKIREEVDWGLFNALLFGTAIWKWGFKSYTRPRTKYVRAGESVTIKSSIPGKPDTKITTPESTQFRKVVEDEEIHTPVFENKDIRYTLVDPGLAVPDIRKAKFVIDRMYLTYRDLIKLKDEEYVTTDENGKQILKKRYDLPSEEEIKEWFAPPQEQPAAGVQSEALVVQGTTWVHHAKAKFQKSTADPLDEPLEVLERWDNDKVITVLNRVKLIRNEPNEFGCIPYLSVNWWNIPDAFWGLGLGRVIGTEQRVQQGIINASLDLASLIVNPMFVHARGSNIQEQQIRQRIGGILTVDVGGQNQPKGIREAIGMLEQPHIPAEVIQQIGLSMQRVESTSGANQQLTMGATPTASKGQMGRSGTGAAGIIQATMNRLGGFAEAFVRQVYEPLLYKVHQMNRDKMPIPYIQQVLGDKLGKDFEFNPEKFLNAMAEFEVLAGSHLAAKSQMSQSLFMMIQLFENPPIMDQLNKITGKIVDVEELLHMVYDVSSFKNTYYKIIRDMSPEEMQRAQQQTNQAQQKLQSQMALNQQKFGQDQQLIDQENQARVVRDVFRSMTKSQIEGQGQPQGV